MQKLAFFFLVIGIFRQTPGFENFVKNYNAYLRLQKCLQEMVVSQITFLLLQKLKNGSPFIKSFFFFFEKIWQFSHRFSVHFCAKLKWILLKSSKFILSILGKFSF